MTQQTPRHVLLQEEHHAEVRLAASFARALTLAAEPASHDVMERLRFARETAVTKAREVRATAPSGFVVSGSQPGGAAVLAGFVPWWQRAASLLPVFVLVLGLLAIDHWSVREQVLAAADFDALLLADDLPPEAYSDPGFVEFLRAPTNP